MKKFFTLVIALVACAAMYAVPQNGLKQLDNVTSSAKAKVEAKRAERVEKLAALSMTTERHAIAANQAALSQANQEEVVTLNFTALDDLKYQPQTQDWFLSMSCMDFEKPEFGYIVKLDYFAPADNYCGTFTEEDMDSNYSYMFTPDGQTVHYTDVDMIVANVSAGKNKTQVVVTATILGSNGVTYKINCVHEMIDPAEKVQTTIKDVVLSINVDEYNFTLAGKNDVMDINLIVRSNRVKGDHSNTVDRMNSQFIYEGKSLSVMSMQAIITAEEVDNELSYVANLKFVSTDTVEYIVTMVSPLPTPTQYVDVVCENLTMDESLSAYYGYVYAEAKNDDYEILGEFPGMTAVAGTYTEGVELYITNNATWNQVEALQYNLVLGLDAAGKWTLTGTARCSDNVVYNLDLKWVDPVADEIVKITYDVPATVYYTPTENHKLEFYNDQGEWFAYVAVAGVKPGEPFGVDKVLFNECFLMNNYNWDMPQISDINGVVEQSNDTTKMLASFTCFDGKQYDIEMYYAIPTPSATETYTIQATFNDQIEQMGAIQVVGYTPDSLIAVSMAMTTEQIEGTYGNDGLFGRLGAEDGMFDFVDNFTYVGTRSGNGYVMNKVLKGQVVVTKDASDNITAEVDVICDNSVRYLITMVCPAQSAGLEYDAQEGEVNRTYNLTKDYVTFETNTDANGAIILFNIEAADGSDMVSLIFFADNIDKRLTVPVGTYAINDSQASGSVLACQGVMGNSIYPSFYATLTEYGDLNTLYMLVDGTVVVSQNELGNLHVEVDALNSYERPVHIVYDDDTTPSAVEDVQTEQTTVSKQIKNNQLYILRNGEIFNVMGAKVK